MFYEIEKKELQIKYIEYLKLTGSLSRLFSDLLNLLIFVLNFTILKMRLCWIQMKSLIRIENVVLNFFIFWFFAKAIEYKYMMLFL